MKAFLLLILSLLSVVDSIELDTNRRVVYHAYHPSVTVHHSYGGYHSYSHPTVVHVNHGSYGYHPRVIHVNNYHTPTVRVIDNYHSGHPVYYAHVVHHRTSPVIIVLAAAIGLLACVVIGCVWKNK